MRFIVKKLNKNWGIYDTRTSQFVGQAGSRRLAEKVACDYNEGRLLYENGMTKLLNPN